MDELVSSLHGRGLSFAEKVTNAQAILTDEDTIFPGKEQFVLDWLLSSLLKIGKFDDSNRYRSALLMSLFPFLVLRPGLLL